MYVFDDCTLKSLSRIESDFQRTEPQAVNKIGSDVPRFKEIIGAFFTCNALFMFTEPIIGTRILFTCGVLQVFS